MKNSGDSVYLRSDVRAWGDLGGLPVIFPRPYATIASFSSSYATVLVLDLAPRCAWTALGRGEGRRGGEGARGECLTYLS